MRLQVSAQTFHVACVEEVHGAAKGRVFNALMRRETQIIGDRRFLNALFQSRPIREPALASDGELCVAEAQLSVKDCGVGCPREPRVKFPDSLGYL
jgi:hypothetical protein